MTKHETPNNKINDNSTAYERTAAEDTGTYMDITSTKSSPKIPTPLNDKLVKLAWRFPNLYLHYYRETN